MTAVTAPPRPTSAPAGRGDLTGLRRLVRFNLRRDRLRLLAWFVSTGTAGPARHAMRVSTLPPRT